MQARFKSVVYGGLIISLILPLLFSCSRPNPDVRMAQAWKDIKNPHSSTASFDFAIKELKHVKGDSNFWLKIAANDNYDPDRRRKCVRHFFDSFAGSGMQMDDVTKLMPRDVNWISFDRIIMTDPKSYLAGWVPEALRKGNRGFIIPILSNKGGHYNLTIDFTFQEKPRLEDFIKILKHGRKRANTDLTLTVSGYTAWDSDDANSRYPGARLLPWPW